MPKGYTTFHRHSEHVVSVGRGSCRWTSPQHWIHTTEVASKHLKDRSHTWKKIIQQNLVQQCPPSTAQLVTPQKDAGTARDSPYHPPRTLGAGKGRWDSSSWFAHAIRIFGGVLSFQNNGVFDISDRSISTLEILESQRTFPIDFIWGKETM